MRFIVAAWLLTLLGFSHAIASEPDTEADYTVAKKIVQDDLIPHYWAKEGFTVAPRQIDYENFPKLKPFLDRSPTLWKAVQRAIATEYEKREGELNDKLRPSARQWKNLLKDAFHKTCELRGGGSASATLFVYSDAHCEWLIARSHPISSPYISNDELASTLKEYFQDLTDNDLSAYASVANQLSKVDRFLTQPEAAFFRKEFLAYFKPD